MKKKTLEIINSDDAAITSSNYPTAVIETRIPTTRVFNSC